jgi:hypothetical protein
MFDGSLLAVVRRLSTGCPGPNIHLNRSPPPAPRQEEADAKSDLQRRLLETDDKLERLEREATAKVITDY